MKTRYYEMPFLRKGLLPYCIFGLLLVIMPAGGHSQIARWTFESIGSAVPSLPIKPDSKLPRLDASATLRGGNNNGSPDECSGNETWSTNFWPTGSSRDDNAYIEFSISPYPGEYFEIDYFSFTSNASSSSSALNFEVYYSKNNFGTKKFLFSGTQSTGGCSSHGGSVGASLPAGTTMRFRIYPYGQNVAAQAATIRIDNVSISGTLLPVTLTSFQGRQEDHSVSLQWTTATEINNDYFTIERSKDGVAFKPLGNIQGVGNSQTEQQYQFLDPQPFSGDNYYRLRQVDFDGKEEIHPILHVYYEAGEAEQSLKIWPTVVSTSLQISTNRHLGKGTLMIRNMNGRLLQTLEVNSSKKMQSLPLNDLQSGWYLVQFRTDEGLISRRFFKS